MTDNVDFKAAKEWAKARKDARLSEVRNVARAIMALCELLKDLKRAEHKPGCFVARAGSCTCGMASLHERIRAAIGEQNGQAATR